MATTTWSSKKPKIVCFDIPKPINTSLEELEVIDDSPNVSLTTVEEEEPTTPPSSSKSPLISPSSSPPKSPLVSPTQTPPPSLTKEPTPPMETDHGKSSTKSPMKSPTKSLMKSLTKSMTKPPTKSPTKTETTTVDLNPSSEKPTSEGKSLSTLTPSSKSKRKFKLKDIVKPNFVPMKQLVEVSKQLTKNPFDEFVSYHARSRKHTRFGRNADRKSGNMLTSKHWRNLSPTIKDSLI